MALHPTSKGNLDLFFSKLQRGGDKTLDPISQFPFLVKKAKQLGATDDDLKPYYDQFSKAGFNFDANTLSATAAPQGQVGTTTPSTPVNTPDTSAKVPINPNLPTDVPGQTIPGPSIPLNSDQGKIEQEAAREKQQGLDVLGQQRDIRQSVLTGLMPILQKQADQQFSYDLPGVKEDLQANGLFDSNSALSNAVARERAQLLQPQLTALSGYGLDANNQYASGLGDILGNQQQLQQGGLQRQFSLADYDKQAQLARDIGAQMVPNGPSPFLTGLQGAGTGAAIGSAVPGIGTGVGAAVGGGLGLLGGMGSQKGGGK